MSGKQSKRTRKAAAAPAPPSTRSRGERRASPKVLIGALVAFAVVGIAVGLGIALTGGSSASTTPVRAQGSLASALPGAADVQRLYAGIPQTGNVLGSPKAPVTLVEYVDLQCPYCRTFETDAMPALISRYVRTGKVKIEQRLLAFIGTDSVRGRLAAIAAGKQGKLFNLTELLYYHQGAENTGWLSEDLVTAAASSIPGVAVHDLLATADSASTKAQADTFDRVGKEESINSTPTILVGKSGQTPTLVTLSSPSDGQPVADAIEQALS